MQLDQSEADTISFLFTKIGLQLTTGDHIPSIGNGGAAKQPELFCCSASK